MILDLIPENNQILHQKVKKCSYNLDRKELSKTLIENMKHHDGLGLSANQIGIPERAFAMIRDIEHNEVIVCFNPVILDSSGDLNLCEEGCLSYPDKFINVRRPDKIDVMYEDEEGKEHKIKLEGFPSRVFQHEYDHLEGIDFTQRQ